MFTNQQKKNIWQVVMDYKKKREGALNDLGLSEEEFKEEVFNLRAKVFDDFEENLDLAKEALKENGFVVHEVKDEDEAKLKAAEVFGGAKFVAKSKSGTIGEISLKEKLVDLGIEVDETDLGDFVVNLMKEEDQHYVLPAIHLNKKEIAGKIKEVYGEKIEVLTEKIVEFLCGKIREKILKADVGLTGANFFTQDGRVVLLENEGNISLVSRLPKKHVIVCGIDKLVENVEDATVLCRAAAVFGTGQKFTQYVSIISGPSKTADIENELVKGAQGPKETHIILVDNGRRAMAEKGFSDLFRCINCGACLNFCPVYHQEGSEYGGRKYAGSKGIVSGFLSEKEKSAGLKKSLEAGSFKCTLCGNCAENCPMKIDLPGMVRKIRQKQAKIGLQTSENKKMLERVEKHGNPFEKTKNEKNETGKELYCC